MFESHWLVGGRGGSLAYWADWIASAVETTNCLKEDCLELERV